MHRHTLASAVIALMGLSASGLSQAGEIYAPLGIPGWGVGYAHPVNGQLTLRGDYMTLGTRSGSQTEDGIEYDAQLKLNRAAIFADWFPWSGRFRLTAGLAATNYKLEMDASGAGRTITVGDTPYTLTSADGLNVQVKFPSTMPYLGLGWGHQTGSGLRFSFDLGALIGKAKVSATGRGQLASSQAQADIDKELQELRDGVGKTSFIPQISLGLGYSF